MALRPHSRCFDATIDKRITRLRCEAPDAAIVDADELLP